ENRDVSYGLVFKVDPEIGRARTAVLVVGADQVLPAGNVELLAHGVQSVRIIHAGLREAIAVDGDAIHPRDHAAQVFVVLVQLGGEHQHRVVQGELGSR